MAKRLVHGVGFNDADYVIAPKINGKQKVCPFYRSWVTMLMRAYWPQWRQKYPTYEGVTVCEEWHTFSNYRRWMVSQQWKGMQLDKDIIKPGNKEYRPDYCCFVSGPLNKLLTDSGAARGKFPIGVTYKPHLDKFEAASSAGKSRIYLGVYYTPEGAHAAYVKHKTALIRKTASEQTDDRIAVGLHLHADILESTCALTK